MAIARSDRGRGPGCPKRVTVLRKWAAMPGGVIAYDGRWFYFGEHRQMVFSITPAGRKALAEAKGAKHGK